LGTGQPAVHVETIEERKERMKVCCIYVSYS
jgi:hypothetical protein